MDTKKYKVSITIENEKGESFTQRIAGGVPVEGKNDVFEIKGLSNTECLFKISRNLLGVFSKASASLSGEEWPSKMMAYKEYLDQFYQLNYNKEIKDLVSYEDFLASKDKLP